MACAADSRSGASQARPRRGSVQAQLARKCVRDDIASSASETDTATAREQSEQIHSRSADRTLHQRGARARPGGAAKLKNTMSPGQRGHEGDAKAHRNDRQDALAAVAGVCQTDAPACPFSPFVNGLGHEALRPQSASEFSGLGLT